MKDAIKEKLAVSLGSAPGTEAEVVYAFVEIRKLLERERRKKDFKALTFFCDWVVHVQLNRGSTPDMLSVLDERLPKLNLSSLDDIGYDEDLHRFTSLSGLKDELERFCQEMELPANWTTNFTSWYECVRLYGEVVRDCALTVNRSGCAYLYIQRIVLTTTEVERDAHGVRLKFDWQFTLSDGRSFQLAQIAKYL